MVIKEGELMKLVNGLALILAFIIELCLFYLYRGFILGYIVSFLYAVMLLGVVLDD